MFIFRKNNISIIYMPYLYIKQACFVINVHYNIMPMYDSFLTEHTYLESLDIMQERFNSMIQSLKFAHDNIGRLGDKIFIKFQLKNECDFVCSKSFHIIQLKDIINRLMCDKQINDDTYFKLIEHINKIDKDLDF